MRAGLATRKPFSGKLEFHDLYVRDTGYGYDRVGMNQPVGYRGIHNLSTNQIQHISADHQHDRFG
jgi:hypothetical protein